MDVTRTSWLFFWIFLAVQVTGCASPSWRMDERAVDLGYSRVLVQGEGYDHVAYIKPARTKASPVLHVYLEGDGTPWVHRRVAAADPTPRTPMMFDLMSLDPASSVYLGRPCYHGLNKTNTCTPDLWTDRRYSEVVVSSMAAALNRLSAEYPALVLFGYSGGGTLAMLIAERLPKVEAVITVAANLDTQRWSELHKQHALNGSLNPATRPPLPPRIRQMHFAGEDDDNVPPALIREAISRQRGAEFTIYPRQDHACCWREVWPEILGGLVAD